MKWACWEYRRTHAESGTDLLHTFVYSWLRRTLSTVLGKVANPACGQLNRESGQLSREINISLSAYVMYHIENRKYSSYFIIHYRR